MRAFMAMGEMERRAVWMGFHSFPVSTPAYSYLAGFLAERYPRGSLGPLMRKRQDLAQRASARAERRERFLLALLKAFMAFSAERVFPLPRTPAK